MNNKLKGLLEIYPGAGNLRLDLLFASNIGPQRIVHGSKVVKVLQAGQGILVASTTGSLGVDSPSFVRVYLAQNQTGPVPILFGNTEGIGNTGIPVNLIGTAVAGQEVSRYFDTILLPSEELYAKSAVAISLLVAQVWF